MKSKKNQLLVFVISLIMFLTIFKNWDSLKSIFD
jgi:uncharacterized membrane protein